MANKQQASTLVATGAPRGEAPFDPLRQLASALRCLNPPQQDYDVLGEKTGTLLTKLPPGPSQVKALAAYFELFACGYSRWQVAYDYPKIHEYFYGAYLQAIADGEDTLTPATRDMLHNFSLAMIQYTWCENSLISNDAKGLFDASSAAARYGRLALEWLLMTGLDQRIILPLQQYLDTNLHLWDGLTVCAKGYLINSPDETLSEMDQATVRLAIDHLKTASYELYSELHAHWHFVQLRLDYLAHRTSTLRVEQADLLLRGIGYVGENLVQKFFEACKTEAGRDAMCEAASKATGLPIREIGESFLPDSYETVLGEDYLAEMSFEMETELNADDDEDAVVFDASDSASPNNTANAALTLRLYDGEQYRTYPIKRFRVTVSAFGSLSVEFQLDVTDASVSHVRVLESLVGPHAGYFDLVWKNAPQDPVRDAEDYIVQGAADYVDYLVKNKSWLSRIKGDLTSPYHHLIGEMDSIIAHWEAVTFELTSYLKRIARTDGRVDGQGSSARVQAIYHEFEDILDRAKQLAVQLEDRFGVAMTASVHNAPPATLAQGQRIFPEGRRYRHLMEIGEVALTKIRTFLEEQYPNPEAGRNARKSEPHGDEGEKGENSDAELVDVRYYTAFDATTGWQSVLVCNQIVMVDMAGNASDPITVEDFHRIQQHPEFKGLIIQNREARAGLDDWQFVAMPQYRNLGTISSHTIDTMVIGENRALLWFPDDPQFLITQYTSTAKLIADIRTLVLTFNLSAKLQIAFLEGYFEATLKTLRRSRQLKNVLDRRGQIETFRTHAEKVLDLLRSCSLAKYQDHAELLKAALVESRASEPQHSLERNIENLDRFYTYLSNVAQGRINDRDRFNQGLIATILFALTFVQALAVIPSLGPFLIRQWGHMFAYLAAQSALTLGGIVVVVVALVGAIVVLLRRRFA